MKKRVKITTKKVQEKIDSLVAAHLLTGGEMPVRIRMGNRAYQIATHNVHRKGVEYRLADWQYKLDMKLEYAGFDVHSMNGIFKQVYLPGLKSQLNNSTILLRALERTP